jgi:hypothetical protein
MAGLDDLLPQRREYLLWFYGRHVGAEPEDVDRMVREADRPCAVPISAMELNTVPLPVSATTPVAKIRNWLVATFGPTCMTCPTPGDRVDHHATGLVRGLLCNWCNGRVDRCLHVDGCAFANYLTGPPAAGMKIRYPNRGRPPRSPSLDAAGRRARREELVAREPDRSSSGLVGPGRVS